MKNCCSVFDGKDIKEKFNLEFEKTDKGVKVHIMPKDESKIESFKKFVDACNDFCDC